jgi:hypothetical protein
METAFCRRTWDWVLQITVTCALLEREMGGRHAN